MIIKPVVGKKIPLIGNKGFTLVELVITLTIAGILLAIAAPNFSGFLARNRLSAQINDLSTDISIARAEAIKRNTGAGVCTSNTGTGCVAGNWASGWLAYYVCPVGDASCVAGTNVVVSTHEALTGNNTLTGTASVILYDKTGVLVSGNGTYTLCDPRLKATRIITILTTGRPSITEGTC